MSNTTNNNEANVIVQAGATIQPPAFRSLEDAYRSSLNAVIENAPALVDIRQRLDSMAYGQTSTSSVIKALLDGGELEEKIQESILDSHDFARAIESHVESCSISATDIDGLDWAIEQAVEDYDISDKITEALGGQDLSSLGETLAQQDEQIADLKAQLGRANDRLAAVERMMEQITTLTRCIVDLAGSMNTDKQA